MNIVELKAIIEKVEDLNWDEASYCDDEYVSGFVDAKLQCIALLETLYANEHCF